MITVGQFLESVRLSRLPKTKDGFIDERFQTLLDYDFELRKIRQLLRVTKSKKARARIQARYESIQSLHDSLWSELYN